MPRQLIHITNHGVKHDNTQLRSWHGKVSITNMMLHSSLSLREGNRSPRTRAECQLGLVAVWPMKTFFGILCVCIYIYIYIGVLTRRTDTEPGVARLGSLHFYSNSSQVSSFFKVKFSSSIYLRTQFELKKITLYYTINRFRLLTLRFSQVLCSI